MPRVTCGVPTRNRYDLLALTLQSIATQTFKDIDVIIVDDGDKKDIREMPNIAPILHLFDHYKIGWKVLFGSGRGQHIAHQIIQDEAQTDWIWRIDDDEVAEPDALSHLLMWAGRDKKIGAIGGLVLMPGAAPLPSILKTNYIIQPNENIQWYVHGEEARSPISVDHLHSTFLYRKGIAKYEPDLSPAAHREETLFTYSIRRAGYQVLVLPTAITWHFRAPHGGIRSHTDVSFWEHDERLFEEKLQEWGVRGPRTKTVVLDCGIGDHIVLKSLIPDLKKKYEKLTIAACYPDVFADDDVDLISIADAKNRFGNIDRFNIYRWCIDHQWKRPLREAFRGLYDV